MNNTKDDLLNKDNNTRKRNSKSLNNGIDNHKRKDTTTNDIKTEDNGKEDTEHCINDYTTSNCKLHTLHQRNKSTQRLGSTCKESIMQRLMEAKRKKKLFQQKQEVLNGKRSEIDKELNDDNNNNNNSSSSNKEKSRNDDVCNNSNNNVNNNSITTTNNTNNNIQIKEEVKFEISSHREQILNDNNINSSIDSNSNNKKHTSINVESNTIDNNTNKDIIIQDVSSFNIPQHKVTTHVKEMLTEEKKQLEDSRITEIKKREERKRREESRQAEAKRLKDEMLKKEELKIQEYKKLEEKLSNKTPSYTVKPSFTYTTTKQQQQQQQQPYRKAYHSSNLNQTVNKHQTRTILPPPQDNNTVTKFKTIQHKKCQLSELEGEHTSLSNSKRFTYGSNTNLLSSIQVNNNNNSHTSAKQRMSPKPTTTITSAYTNINNQNTNFNARLTYHKPNNKSIVNKVSSPIPVVYSPKKVGMRSCSNDRTIISSNNNSNNSNNNIATYPLHHQHQQLELSKKPNFTNTISSSSKRNRPSITDLPLYNQQQHQHSINEPQEINLQDLLIIEEKLRDILYAFRSSKSIKNECFEWWNYFYHCTLHINLEQIFKDVHSKSIMQRCIKVQLLTLLISYDSSIDKCLFSKVDEVLYSMLQCNHFNWGTICEYILSKIAIGNYNNNPWVEKLRSIVIKNQNKIQNANTNATCTYIERIELNTQRIYNDIRVILKNYHITNHKTKVLLTLFKTIDKVTYSDLHTIFQEQFMQVDNANASVLASVVLKENSNFKPVPAPYIKTKSLKQYTLVLDLDETIMHFKVNPKNELEGVLRVRPGIYDFLDQLSEYYEMIIFTAATQDYADILIDSIEESKIYFEYRLYRQHAVIVDNDFVKDLTRIGRSLDRVVIVDNMPQNFRLQQDNGIIIKPFWGEDINDSALYELMPILMNIASEGGDIRNGLARYRVDIIRKVSSNLSRQVDY